MTITSPVTNIEVINSSNRMAKLGIIGILAIYSGQ